MGQMHSNIFTNPFRPEASNFPNCPGPFSQLFLICKGNSRRPAEMGLFVERRVDQKKTAPMSCQRDKNYRLLIKV